ncbi:MAG: hypothetical protein QXN62_04620, partial [Candidatus Bathyarchaeia archaeon]
DECLSRLVQRLAEAGVRHVTASTYKVREDSFRRLIQTFPSLETTLNELYYRRGSRIGRARYLPFNVRFRLIMKVREEADKYGMSFASCREGLSQLQNSVSCDSTHTIPERSESIAQDRPQSRLFSHISASPEAYLTSRP